MKGGDDQANNKNDKKAESHKRTETINKLQAKRRQAFTQRANVRQAATEAISFVVQLSRTLYAPPFNGSARPTSA